MSREACIILGLIPADFPKQSFTSNQNVTNADPSLSPCGCMKRTQFPDTPEEIPFEPVEENRGKFQNYFNMKLKASAFNMCIHEPLPRISGEPMKIHFREGTIPIADSIPATVPLHWREEVRELLHAMLTSRLSEKFPRDNPPNGARAW